MFIHKNIAFLRKKKSLSQGDLADRLSIGRTSVSNYEKAVSKPEFDTLITISKLFDTSLDDLINKDLSRVPKNETSVGIPASSAATNDPKPAYTTAIPTTVTVDNTGKENIVMVDVKAAAGYGSSIQEPSFFKKLPAFSLPGPQFRNALFRAFEVDGDSMYDTLDHGDWVICRYLDQSFHEIKDGYIHVLVTQDEVWVKRLLNRSKEREKIVMLSDNEAYPPREVDVSDVKEIWLVKGRLGFNLRSRRLDYLKQLNTLQADLLELRNRVTKIEKKK